MSESPTKGPEQFPFTISVVTRENSHLLAKIRQAVDGIEDQDKLDRELSKYSEGVVASRIAFLAMDGEDVVGYVEVCVSEPLPEKWPQVEGISDFAYLSRVGTLETYRKRGIGTRLIQLAEEWARNNARDGIWLDYLVDNKDTKDLYPDLEYKKLVEFDDPKKGKKRIIAAKILR